MFLFAILAISSSLSRASVPRALPNKEEKAVAANGADCVLCQVAIPIIKSYLKDEYYIGEITKAMESFCSYVDESVQDVCIQIVDDYIPTIIGYIEQQMEANDICSLLGIC